MSKTDVLIITPLFFGESSGASVYYSLLSKELINKGQRVSIISDRELGEFSGNYYSLFPKRCGQNRRPLLDVVNYAYQNLLYFKIKSIIARERPHTVLIHSSFMNRLNIFLLLLKHWHKVFGKKIRFIIDFRDKLMPGRRISQLAWADGILACSRSIEAFLVSNGMPPEKITHIPVIQEEVLLDQDEIDTVLQKLGLKSKRYILYAGSLKEDKSTDLLLEVFTRHVRSHFPDVALVVVGLLKSRNRNFIKKLRSHGVHFWGSMPHTTVLSLIAGADLCINLSPSEGLPRFILEALALHRPVLVNAGVGEFDFHCPECIVHGRKPDQIAQQVMEMLREPKFCHYPIEEHLPANIIDAYEKLLAA